MGAKKKKKQQRRRALPKVNDGPQVEFREQHDALKVEGTGVSHYRVTTQTYLDRYHARKELDPQDRRNNERLWIAGDQLRADLYLGQVAPRMVSQLTEKISRVTGDGGADGAQIDARRRVADALHTVGPFLVPILVHVCGDHGPAADYANRFRGRSGAMMTLQTALEHLARFYRIGLRREANRKA